MCSRIATPEVRDNCKQVLLVEIGHDRSHQRTPFAGARPAWGACGGRSCRGCTVEREVPVGKTVRADPDVQMCAGIYYLLTMLRHASRMLPVSASHLTRADHMDQGVDARHLSLGHRGLVMPFASDPELTARREIKLLWIEVEQLRAVERMFAPNSKYCEQIEMKTVKPRNCFLHTPKRWSSCSRARITRNEKQNVPVV